MNSCIYETKIMHCRLKPKKHQLSYSFFSFYLDLDEIDEIVRKIPMISFNQKNIYSFDDADHLELDARPVKDKIRAYLMSQGMTQEIGKIKLLTYLRTWGYIFNPVSFYFCFDQQGVVVALVVEIGNTFREIKPFLIKQDKFDGRCFKDEQIKYYYISPFTDLDDSLEFRISVPDDYLNICIDTSRDGQRYMMASMTGRRKELTLKKLLWYTFRFPFVTLAVIALIHWHALLLFFKRVPFHRKEEDLQLQKGVLSGRHKD